MLQLKLYRLMSPKANRTCVSNECEWALLQFPGGQDWGDSNCYGIWDLPSC